VFFETFEKLKDKLVSNFWFKLFIEFLGSDQIIIKVKGPIHKIFNAIIQVLWKNFGSTFIQSSKPDVKIFDSLINDILQFLICDYKCIDRSHQEREQSNTKELNGHLEEILSCCVTFLISVSYSC